MGKDFYVVLRVSPDATGEEIRSAYRRRAMELHPDKSGADSEPFLELQRAYSVLSNPSQRAAYDHRTDFVPMRRRARPGQRRPVPEPFRDVEPAEAFRDVSLAESFETFSPSFEEIFERLWSNFDDSLSRPKSEGLESLTVDVPLTPDQAWSGGSVRVMVPARTPCRTCRGRGAVGRYECWRCLGHGAVAAEFPVDIVYPGGLRRTWVARVPLDAFGIHNLFLTVRFRPVGAG